MPGPGPVYSESWQIMYGWLIPQLRAEAVPGGCLKAFKVIDEVNPPEHKLRPALGIQFARTTEDFDSQNHMAQLSEFGFTLLADFDFQPSVTDPVKEAKLAAENLWNDQGGYGLGPFLREHSTLGENAQWVRVKDLIVMVGRAKNDASKYSAMVAGTLQARDRLEVGLMP